MVAMVASVAGAACVLLATGMIDLQAGPQAGPGPVVHQDVALFETSANCVACHNGLTTEAGEDVSIGSEWRASMMANAARDPYWQAAVRRETLDHPGHAARSEEHTSELQSR